MKIEKKSLYFIKDEFYSFAEDSFLMKNKENSRRRPCFLAVHDEKGIIWLVPVSSKVEKYKSISKRKIAKYGTCNTIIFGELLGKECAFLIQNIFPITKEFIKEQYVQKSTKTPVKINNKTAKKIISKSKKVIAATNQGKVGLVFTNIIEIKNKLLKEKFLK